MLARRANDRRSDVLPIPFPPASCQIWQLAGGNGIGKTSLLRSFARLASIEVYGELSRCVDVLYTGHSAALKGAMTPRQNLKYHPSGLCTPRDYEIDEALAAVGLAGYENALTAVSAFS